MKLHLLALILFFFTEGVYTSGIVEMIELQSCLHKDSPVYGVKILGLSAVTIKELKNAVGAENPDLARIPYYSAEITEIINKGAVSSDSKEPWTMLFSPKEKAVLKKFNKSGVTAMSVNDTMFIFDRKDLSNSFTYYINGMHKIFCYYRCPDGVQKIEVGKTYLFISNKYFSAKSSVFYGNIDYGLYPDDSTMRKKVADILEKSN